MQKLTASACLIALAAVFAGGCQKSQTVGLDEPVPLPETQATQSEPPSKGLAGIFPWNWGNREKQPDPITAHDVLRDMSPELADRGKTQGELDIEYHRSIDTNLRTADDDILRMFFFDSPLRLSLYPTP